MTYHPLVLASLSLRAFSLLIISKNILAAVFEQKSRWKILFFIFKMKMKNGAIFLTLSICLDLYIFEILTAIWFQIYNFRGAYHPLSQMTGCLSWWRAPSHDAEGRPSVLRIMSSFATQYYLVITSAHLVCATLNYVKDNKRKFTTSLLSECANSRRYLFPSPWRYTWNTTPRPRFGQGEMGHFTAKKWSKQNENYIFETRLPRGFQICKNRGKCSTLKKWHIFSSSFWRWRKSFFVADFE